MEQWFQWCEFEVVLYDDYVEGQLVLFTVYVNGMLTIETPSSIDIVVADLRPLFALNGSGTRVVPSQYTGEVQTWCDNVSLSNGIH